MDPISIGLGAASIGSGLIGGLLGRSDANKAARAQEEAARLQYQAAQDAIAEQRRQYDQGRQDLAAYRGAGQFGVGELISGMQSDRFAAPEFGFQENQFNYQADPGYQLRIDEAMKAIQASKAASGMLGGGGTLRAINREAQGLASQEYGNAYNRFQGEEATRYGRASDTYNRTYGARQDTANRLMGLGNMGQASAAQTANMGANMGGNIGQLGMSGAQGMGQGMTNAAMMRGQGNQALFSGLGSGLGDAARLWSARLWSSRGLGGLGGNGMDYAKVIK
jgi:hypothetical protein